MPNNRRRIQREPFTATDVGFTVFILARFFNPAELPGRRLNALTPARIIATHDLELAVEVCPHTLVMSEGRIAAAGPTVDLLNDAALMEQHGLERPHILRHRHPH